MQGCTLVWWLGLLPHSKWVPGSNLSRRVCKFSPCMRGFSPPTPQNKHIGFHGDSKLTLGVSVDGCLSRFPLCGPLTCPGCALSLAQYQLG